MNDKLPLIRRDLEFVAFHHQGQQLILIRDPLGLVQEGKAIQVPLYQLMIMLDGTRDIRGLQMELMRSQGGLLIGADEILKILDNLDDSFLLDSERFRSARNGIIAELVLPVFTILRGKYNVSQT